MFVCMVVALGGFRRNEEEWIKWISHSFCELRYLKELCYAVPRWPNHSLGGLQSLAIVCAFSCTASCLINIRRSLNDATYTAMKINVFEFTAKDAAKKDRTLALPS